MEDSTTNVISTTESTDTKQPSELDKLKEEVQMLRIYEWECRDKIFKLEEENRRLEQKLQDYDYKLRMFDSSISDLRYELEFRLKDIIKEMSTDYVEKYCSDILVE